ncbi:hypothetical protein K438DRAFT_1996708 [Mycena galopus ATCC 62051]|nr:hypothetical protein K438DRAFT_1996708 [Mycena galopus ATCC 62051]
MLLGSGTIRAAHFMPSNSIIQLRLCPWAWTLGISVESEDSESPNGYLKSPTAQLWRGLKAPALSAGVLLEARDNQLRDEHQFFLVAFLAVLSTTVSASPINPLLSRAGTCNVNTCVAALAPAFPTDCNPAVAQQGANTALNTACLAAAAKGTAPFPTACTPCASQFGVTDPANNAATAKNNNNGSPVAGTPATAKSPNNAAAAAPVGPRANTCDIKSCVITLGPSFPPCAPAVAQLGADNTFNGACLTAAAKGPAAFRYTKGGSRPDGGGYYNEGTVTRKAAAADYGGNYTNGGDSWLGNAGTYIESSSSTVMGAVTLKVAASSNGGSYTGQ